jgi:hypothetical protein
MGQQEDDWLLQAIAASTSPFQGAQPGRSPFKVDGQPEADEFYGTSDVLRMQESRKPNIVQRGLRWAIDKLPHFSEKAPRQSIDEALASDPGAPLPAGMAAKREAFRADPQGFRESMYGKPSGPQPVGLERFTDAPARLANLAVGIPHAVGSSAHAYAGAVDRTNAGGFAGTGVMPEHALVPPNAIFSAIPKLRSLIEAGERNPISTYDTIRARMSQLGDQPIPFLGRVPHDPAVYGAEAALARPGPVNPNHANPMSPQGQSVQRALEEMQHPDQWPKPPPDVKAGVDEIRDAGLPYGNMKRLPGHAANSDGIELLKLNAKAENTPLSGIVAQATRRTEPLPMTAAVAEWVKMATGKDPNVRAARGGKETDYVGLPHGKAEYERLLPRTKVRVPSDGHPGAPEAGLIDTAPSRPGRMDRDTYSRVNAEGGPYSHADNLLDALKWATSSSPEGNWLVSPGKEPRWARYAREGEGAVESGAGGTAEAVQGALRPSPLASSVGELWAKTDNPFAAAISAMRLDPEKAKTVSKALESMRGLNDSQIAGVLKSSYGIDPSVSVPALISNPRFKRSHAGISTPSSRREAREKAALTERFWATWDKHAGRQVDIAKELGVTQATVSRWANPGTPQHRPRPSAQSAEAAAAQAERKNVYTAPLRQGWTAERAAAANAARWSSKRELPSVATKPGTARPVGPLVEGVVERAAQQMRGKEELDKRGGKTFWDEHGKAAQQQADVDYVQGLVKKIGKSDDTLYADVSRGSRTIVFARGRENEAYLLKARLGQLQRDMRGKHDLPHYGVPRQEMRDIRARLKELSKGSD